MGPSSVARVSLVLTSLFFAAPVMSNSITGNRGASSVHIPAFHDKSPLRRVCYFTLPPEMTLGNASADYCTHLVCGFAVVRNGSLVPERPEDVSDYDRLVALKRANPALKVMLSLGSRGKDGVFSAAIATKERRHRFLESAVALLRKHGFDGLDLDWEFPGQGAPPEQDRENLGLLLKEAREVFSSESRTGHRNQLLLSIAVPGTEELINQGYDARLISRYCDFINLMSYDYHMYQPYLPFTGHNSPLLRRNVEKGIFATLHVAWSAEYWVQRGADRSKLNVGLSVYGRTYTLLRPQLHGFDAPTTGVGPGADGSVDYVWVCQFLKGGAISVFDDESQVPYAYQNLTWVGYDDVASIRSKVVWTMARGYGGVMTFALNQDDANNVCGHGSFPIHTMIRNMLQTS